MMGARIMSDCKKFLGLPMVSGKSKVSTIKELQEKITKRVMGGRRSSYPKPVERS